MCLSEARQLNHLVLNQAGTTVLRRLTPCRLSYPDTLIGSRM